MSVKIRLKMMGRRHRPFFRMVVTDARTPRDGRVIEEVGTYDPMIPETDARCQLVGERIDYWRSVGAQPSEKAGVLIKKYGKDGTHLDAQKQALDRLALSRRRPGLPAELPPAAETPGKKRKKKNDAATAAAAVETAPVETPASE
ncbi:MAG: 30S ribosomal protein S16 [Thermoguttaceae bacterium]